MIRQQYKPILRPLKRYLEEIHDESARKAALKKINRAYALKKEFPITPDTSDVNLSKALEMYASIVMTEKFIVEANKFIMNVIGRAQFVQVWANELYEYRMLVLQQMELAEKLIRAIIIEREKQRDQSLLQKESLNEKN